MTKTDVPRQRPTARNHDRNRISKPAAVPNTSQLPTAFRLIGFAARVASLAPGSVSGSCSANCTFPVPDSPGVCRVSFFFPIRGQPRRTCCIGRDGNLARRPRRSWEVEPRRDEPSASDAVGDSAESRFESPEPSREAWGPGHVLTSS
jgi:hypothetical protein